MSNHIRIVDVLKVSADCDFVLLIVLIDHHLISSDRSKVNVSLFVEVPAIIIVFKLFRIELLLDG